MKVPFRLRKAASTAPATGLFLPGDDTAALLALLTGAGEPSPVVFAVASGFLLRLARPEERPFPGAVRLRQLAANLFLPADADLLPALFDDEAADLTRARGLLFLPGGASETGTRQRETQEGAGCLVLPFDPAHPLPPSRLLDASRLPDRQWRPLPPRPERNDRLDELVLDLPDDTPDAVLSAGGAGLGVEEPRPSAGGAVGGAVGRAQSGLGRALLWLGNALGWRGLASAGANLIRRALERSPRLSEDILGRQEAALRELLRQFREGDLEAALRRALPVGDDTGRGGQAAGGAELPTHNLRYSLADLLGGGAGRASVWLGGGDVMRDLAAEYRKAAREATERGDWRRAAFIYGKLLRDYRAAAAVLSRGGLHRDAALLYLDKVGDVLAAARSFEAAGDADRAVALFRRHGAHLEAADLLRRCGDEDAALAEYRLAAAEQAAAGNHLAAGELIQVRASRPDLAVEYYLVGWQGRPHSSALPCLERLLDLSAEAGDAERLSALAAEGCDWYGRPAASDADAATFFNDLARLADRPALADRRDRLRDGALLGLATRLRQRAAADAPPAGLVSALLGRAGAWPAAVVADAEAAYQAALRSARPAPPRAREERDRIRVGHGVVSAACGAVEGGVVFVGFEDGAIARFDARSGALTRLAGRQGAVLDLATDPQGRVCVALHVQPEVMTQLVRYEFDGSTGRVSGRRSLPYADDAYRLTPLAKHRGEDVFGLLDRENLEFLTGAEMTPVQSFDLTPENVPLGGVLLPWPGDDTLAALVAVFEAYGPAVESFASAKGVELHLCRVLLGGSTPRAQRGVAARAWVVGGSVNVFLLALDEEGHCHWSRLEGGNTARLNRKAFGAGDDRGFLCAAILTPGQVAAVEPQGVAWLKVGPDNTLTTRGTTRVALANAVACFASPATEELLVVSRDGFVTRVPLPR
jgi:hypothetical protein